MMIRDKWAEGGCGWNAALSRGIRHSARKILAILIARNFGMEGEWREGMAWEGNEDKF
jgi:hypothetical protein